MSEKTCSFCGVVEASSPSIRCNKNEAVRHNFVIDVSIDVSKRSLFKVKTTERGKSFYLFSDDIKTAAVDAERICESTEHTVGFVWSIKECGPLYDLSEIDGPVVE